MRHFLRFPIAFAIGLLLAGDDPCDDVQRIQGTWRMVAREFNGEVSSEGEVKSGRLVIEGNRYSSVLGERKLMASLCLDPSHSPRTLDFTFTEGPRKGETVKAIYKLEGDRLVLCRAMRPEDDRPKQFATRPDSGLLLVVWKRFEESSGSKP